MENYIDLINAYLDQSLSQSEILEFENRLKTDTEFNSIYKEHITILRGIERTELKDNLTKARQNYIRGKWMKYFGISILIVLSIILIVSLFSNKNEFIESMDSSEVESYVVDSSNIKSDEIKEYLVIQNKKQQIEVKELTKLYGGIEVIKDTIIEEVLGLYTMNSFKSEFQNVVDFEIRNDTIIINLNIKEAEDNSKINNEEDKIVKEEQKIKSNTLEGIFKSIKKETQYVKVNNEEDFEIILKEGTKISIPENAFIEVKTGKQVSGKIDLNITEYYKLSDLLLANLTTKSDGKLLETGGMLYIDATKNGSKLQLSPEKKMNIIFNNSGKPNMQLFKGEKNNDGINWKLNAPEIVASEVVEIAFSPESNEETVVPFQLLEVVPVFPGCENGNNTEKKECMSAAINKFVSRKFDTSIAEDLRLTGRQRIMTSFEIDKEGNIGKIEARASHKILAEEAIRVIELLPQLIPGKHKGKAVAVKYSFPIFYTVLEDENDSRDIKEQDSAVFIMKSDKGFIKRTEEKPVILINNSDLERYTFATTNLGWINCDRFVNSKKKKIKYKVKIKDAEGANVKMIFKSISSVLPSKKINDNYSFGEVPIGEDIILLAIKKKDDKIFLGVKVLKTKATSELDLNFKEVTIAELKTELYKLNKGFN